MLDLFWNHCSTNQWPRPIRLHVVTLRQAIPLIKSAMSTLHPLDLIPNQINVTAICSTEKVFAWIFRAHIYMLLVEHLGKADLSEPKIPSVWPESYESNCGQRAWEGGFQGSDGGGGERSKFKGTDNPNTAVHNISYPMYLLSELSLHKLWNLPSFICRRIHYSK